MGPLVALLVVMAFGVFASPSQAAAFKRCGTAGSFYSGAVTLAKMQARNIACVKGAALHPRVHTQVG